MHCILEKAPLSDALADKGQDVFVMPCSRSQQRFWMLEQISPGDTALVIPIAVQLNGPLRIETLERALNGIVQRHEILRTSFALVDDEPKQIIAADASLELERLDFRDVPAEQRRKRVAQAMSQEAKRSILLGRAPLLRATLIQLGPEEAVLMLTAHHIISDGWSNGVLVRELGAFYRAFLEVTPPDLPTLTIQYADYVLWQEEWLKSPDYEKQLAYWKEELDGELPVLDFPTDFARSGEDVHQAILESRQLPAELTGGLKQLCRETGTTLFMIFFSAYLVLLQRYTGQSRLMVGTTGANRNRPELEGLIGLFANILLLRCEVPGETSFRDFLTHQREHLLNSFANHEVPFDRVLEQWQAGQRKMPKNLIRTHFLFQKAFMQPATLGDLTIQPLYSVSPGSTFELTFGIVERAEGIRLQMEYWTNLYRPSTIQRLLAHFEALLAAVVANPEAPVSQLPLFAPGEKEELESGLHSAPPSGPDKIPALDPAEIFQELDRQIVAHFEKDDSPFTREIGLPEGAVLLALDEHLQLLPIGIAGELYLGDRLGRLDGWHDIVAGPPGVSFALLKTGFVGRHTEGGGVELWGRPEDLIGGPVFRFNRRVVEARLKLHPEVADVICVERTQESAATKIVTYVVLKSKAAATGEDLRAFLRGKISDLLVPSQILVVDKLPRNTDGSIITGELPRPAARGKLPGSQSVPLQGMVQQQLMAIWRDILKTQEISINDNFFELGGNSFLALRMMIEAGKLARRTLPLSLLLTGATVAHLARFIVESNAKSDASLSLIPVQTNGLRAPLFFLHGDWVGGGFYCNRLSQLLGGEQPFYAVPPVRTRDEKIPSIGEMAARHRAAVREQFPRGPYFLGGYCIGALVAVEMARQWIEEGEEVAHLFLVDPPVWADRWLAWAWPFFDQLGQVRGWDIKQRINFFDRRPVALNRWLKQPLARKAESLRRLIGLNGGRDSFADVTSSDQEDAGSMEALGSLDYSLYFLAYRLHHIEPLATPATVFIPESTSPLRLSRLVRALKMDPSRCRVQVVPGNHTTCVTQDVSLMAEKMRSILEAR